MTKRKDPDDVKIRISRADIAQIIEDSVGQFDFAHVHWLSDEDYQKAITQLRLNIAGVFDFLRVDDKLPVRYMYGVGNSVQGAIDEAVKLTEDFGLRVRGIDKAISLEIIRRKAIFEFGNNKE